MNTYTTYYRLCVSVDHLSADGFILHASNVNPLLGEQISITAFLPDYDKVSTYVSV